jgi:hypothetical protein
LGDEKWDFATDAVMGETALVAKFIEKVRTFTVTFDGKDAQECAYGSKVVEPETPVKETTATHRYEFLGWFNGDKQWNFATDTVSFNTHLVSKWKEVQLEGKEPSGSETPDEPSTSAPSNDSDAEKPVGMLGCMSVVGGVASGLTALGAAAFVLLKKKED